MHIAERPSFAGKSFDSLAYAKHMEAVGFTRQQAEALAEEQGKLIDERLATKQDVAEVRVDVGTLRIEIKGDLDRLEMKLQNRINELELRIAAIQKDLLLRIGGMIVALGGILIAIKYFG